jgi:uncharacterized zinc-type alcohol dehydrogenase-like protein
MINAHARGITAQGQPFTATTIERREVGPHDVRIDIAYCGICHSDIHRARGGSPASYYPLVPGHEIAGTVAAVGSQVTKFAVGDRAGIGCMVDSCRECDYCRDGLEQFCRKGWVRTYNWKDRSGEPTYGGFSENIVVDENYVISIPPQIPLEAAAPMLCAGVTMYSPLRHWNAGPGKRIAFVGFGGLGHIGVQIGKALGAHVTVLDLSLDKRADGLRLGADEYYSTLEEGRLETFTETFDIVVSTVPASVDLNLYVPMLAANGVFVAIGASERPLSFDAFTLRTKRRSIAGSSIGSIAETQEMMNFCGEHGVQAQVEVVDADHIDEAIDRVKVGDVRFRFVIDISTMARGDLEGREPAEEVGLAESTR